MARPPRGRLPGSGRSSDETSGDELPLELPRVDPIRSRIARPPRTEPKLDQIFEEAETEKGPRRFVPPLRAAIPEPPASPRRMTPEKLDNPFDYYAMPKDENDPLSRPIVKPSAPVPEASEFLTSKYYTPRSELIAKREFDENEDQTANWARSVRPGRPILEPASPQDDDTPMHLRHLPSRVRDHLRAEPRMPVASETLGSFTQSAPTTTQLRARSGVPLPLAPELRAPVPQDVRVTRQIPEMPTRFDADDQMRYADRDEGRSRAVDDLISAEPEFDSASDEAFTEIDRDVPPLVSEDEERAAFEQDAAFDDDLRDDDVSQVPAGVTKSEPPSWMRRTDQPVPPPPVAVSDWDQDEALHALTSRIRNRAVETMERYNNPRAGLLKTKLVGTVGQFGATLRAKARNVQDARARAKADHQARAQLKAQAEAELRASQIAEPVLTIDTVTIEETDYSSVNQQRQKAPRDYWAFFKRKPRAAVVRVSAEANRAVRRKRQSRLYEDVVAWIVVPPFIIGAIYGGLELAKFLSNSPLGKLLSGQ